MKKNEKTTLDKLRPGDIFSMTPRGINLIMGRRRIGSNYVSCRIRGNKESQSLTLNFPVYFIQRKQIIIKPAHMAPVQSELFY